MATAIISRFLPTSENVESFATKLEKRTLKEADVEKLGQRISELYIDSSRQKLAATEFEELKKSHGFCAYATRIREIIRRIEKADACDASANVVFSWVREHYNHDLAHFTKLADEMLAEADCLVVGSSILESVVYSKDSSACALKSDTATLGTASYDIGVLIGSLLFAYHRAISDCVSDESHEKRFSNAIDQYCRVLLNACSGISHDACALTENSKFVREMALIAGCELLQRVADAHVAGALSDSMRKDATECAGRALNACTKVNSFGQFLFIVFMYC